MKSRSSPPSSSARLSAATTRSAATLVTERLASDSDMARTLPRTAAGVLGKNATHGPGDLAGGLFQVLLVDRGPLGRRQERGVQRGVADVPAREVLELLGEVLEVELAGGRGVGRQEPLPQLLALLVAGRRE